MKTGADADGRSLPLAFDGVLNLEPQDWSDLDIFRIFNSVIVPRPIAWVSTRSSDGRNNLAPFSYFNAVSGHPPFLMFSSDGEKNTIVNIRETREFVCNVVSADMVLDMEMSAVDFPPDEDEFEWTGLTPEAAKCVAAPKVRNARIAIECVLDRIIEIGSLNRMVIGRVVNMAIDGSVWRNGRVDTRLLQPLARIGDGYAELNDRTFGVKRPAWSDVRFESPAVARAGMTIKPKP